MSLDWLMPSSSTSTQPSCKKQLVDLNDYYRHDRERQIIHCQICNCDVSRMEVFEHTVSKRHKYNKLFVAVSQNCSDNIDVDFIVLSIDRLRCRYCETLIINSHEDDLVIINHIEDTRHIKKKQERLNGMSGSSAGAAIVDYELLQPLDSLITHNRIYNKRNKSNKKIKTKESLPKIAEAITKELKVTNDVDGKDIQKLSKFSRKYERERGEELPKCISIGELGTCICTICLITIPRSSYNVSGHINGGKHKRKMLKSTQSMCQKLEILDLNKTSLPEPAKLANYRELEKTTKNFDDTKSFSQKNFSQSSEKETSDCISIGENGTRICTIRDTEIPNTPFNIDQHINDTKHKAKMESKLQDGNKSTLPRLKTKMCTTCGIEIKNTKRGLKRHNESPNHKEKMLQIEESTYQTLNLQQMKKSVTASISTTATGTYMCPTCCLLVPNDARSFSIHINGENHKKRRLWATLNLFGF